MNNFQLSIFYDLQMMLQRSSFYRKYFLLFQALPELPFPDQNEGVGCTGHSNHAVFKALLVKHFERIKSIPKLIEILDANPILSDLCGFQTGSIPEETKFYRFLNNTPNSVIKEIHRKLNQRLIENGIATLDTFIMDSKPVMAATRENNFKNPSRNTKNKAKKPKRNPAATLGYYSYQEIPGSKQYLFFWGYRTHVIISKEGIPLVEKTLPNKLTDAEVAGKLIKELKKQFRFKKHSIFIGDKAYDQKKFYNLIIDNLKCQAFIPLNPRNTKDQEIFFSANGTPFCAAGLQMKYAGLSTEGQRKRTKYRCPLKYSRKAGTSPAPCPIDHHSFLNVYGCTKNLDVTGDARSQVPRDSDFFKKVYRKRQTVEQYFSRLGDREVEQTTHYKLRTVQNQMTIAHLSMSLLAVAAGILLKQPDKIRCVSTFANQALVRVA